MADQERFRGETFHDGLVVPPPFFDHEDDREFFVVRNDFDWQEISERDLHPEGSLGLQHCPCSTMSTSALSRSYFPIDLAARGILKNRSSVGFVWYRPEVWEGRGFRARIHASRLRTCDPKWPRYSRRTSWTRLASGSWATDRILFRSTPAEEMPRIIPDNSQIRRSVSAKTTVKTGIPTLNIRAPGKSPSGDSLHATGAR